MPFSLYAATVPSQRQIIGAVTGLVDKARAWCAEGNATEAELIEARLAPDMQPFGYQVKSVATHSRGAMEGVRAGVFTPDMAPWPSDFAGLSALLAAADDSLAALDPGEVDGWEGRATRFQVRDFVLDFVAEDFLLSFSQPNFYFHATTAYALLRGRGVPLGKRDFLGAMRLKR